MNTLVGKCTPTVRWRQKDLEACVQGAALETTRKTLPQSKVGGNKYPLNCPLASDVPQNICLPTLMHIHTINQ